MRIITLRFPSLHQLWKFKILIGVNQLCINASGFLLTCNCTEEQIELAQKQFKAQMFSEQEYIPLKRKIPLRFISALTRLGEVLSPGRIFGLTHTPAAHGSFNGIHKCDTSWR